MRIFFIISLFFISIYADTILLDQETKSYNLVPRVAIYVDTNSSANIKDILHHRYLFEQNTKELLYYHFNTATYWFKFSIQNNSSQIEHYKLTIPTAWLDHVTLYSIQKDGNYTMQHSGDRVKAEDKSVHNRSIVFSLNIPTGESHYYIKIRSNDALQLPMFLMQEQSFQEDENKLNLFFAFLAGTIFMMFMYALFYLIYLKDYLYGIYMGYILTFIVMVLSTHGYFLYYLWPDAFGFNEWMYELSFIGYLGFMIWFAKEFLQVKTFSPQWNTFLQYAVVAHFFIVLLSPVLPYPLIMQIGVYSGALTPFVLLFPAIISLKHHHPLTRIYLLGWSINIGFYTLWALSFFAILPYTLFLNNANSIGVLIELLIFSVGMVYRVERIVQSNHQLSSDLKTDALTQVLNRHAFNIEFPLQLEEAAKENKNLYFAMLDIDNFKRYNDTYGHPQGDEALKRVASTLDKRLHRACDKIYRLGGEEFALILCEHDMTKAHKMVESLRKAIERERIIFDGAPQNILTVSFGLVGIASGSVVDYTTVYQYADELLYKAKESGRNCVISKEIS